MPHAIPQTHSAFYPHPKFYTSINSADYSTCVVYTKSIIHLSVGESGGYWPPLWWTTVNYSGPSHKQTVIYRSCCLNLLLLHPQPRLRFSTAPLLYTSKLSLLRVTSLNRNELWASKILRGKSPSDIKLKKNLVVDFAKAIWLCYGDTPCLLPKLCNFTNSAGFSATPK